MVAAVLCFVFLAWPFVAFVGGSGFSPLAGVAALATAPVSLPRIRMRLYMLALLASLLFAAASAFWSPRPLAFFDFQKLSVRSEVLRLALLLTAAGALIAAVPAMSDRARKWVTRIATAGFLIQFLIVCVLAVFEKPAVLFFYGAEGWGEGVQNITRNTIVMTVAAPFLILGLGEGRRTATALVNGALIAVAIIAILIAKEVDAGLLAIFAVLAFNLIIRLAPRNGFRVIGLLIASLIMSAPFLFQLISYGVNATDATSSIQYRQVIWQRVIEIIWEKPILGSGVGVLRTHLEVIPEGVFAGQLYIPNHAHNMLLQLWAETGVVGAGLVSLTVLLAAFRLPRPDLLGLAAPRVVAIIGGFMATWVSFDLWNEAWWAVCALLAVLTVVRLPRTPASAINKGPLALTNG